MSGQSAVSGANSPDAVSDPSGPSGPSGTTHPSDLGQVWDRLAPRYRLQEPLEARSLAEAVRLSGFATGELALDLGCGTGALRRHLPGGALHVGVDRSAAMLRAGRRGPVLRADVTALPLPDGLVDLCVASWVLHLLPDTGRAAVLAEVRRVLRPGGRLVAVVPGPTTPAGAVLRRVATAATRRAGSVLREVPALAEEVEAAGLVVERDVVVRGGYTARVVRATRP